MPFRKETRDKLGSPDSHILREGISDLWKDRFDKKYKLTTDEFGWLERQFHQMNDVSILSEGLAVMAALRHCRESSIREFFWSPFDTRAAFLGVSDGEIRKDSQWMLALSQHLPRVAFLWVQAENDHCAPPDLAEYSAICQIGRDHPSYPTTELLPRDKGVSLLRFGFPPLPRRGAAISPEEHRVLQFWRGKVYREYPTTETTKEGPRGQYAERTDYAVVQRFRVPYRGTEIVAVILAGPSSLATAAAIMCATGLFSHPEKFDRYQEHAGKVGTLSASSQVEVLLKVTSGVHEPRIPWEPKWEVEKFFINNSPNLARKPSTIWTHPELRFDDDVIDPKEDYAAVVALCRAASKTRVVQLNDLVKDKSLWPDGRIRWSSGTDALNDYREMQKGVLKGIFHFSQGIRRNESPLATLQDDISIVSEEDFA